MYSKFENSLNLLKKTLFLKKLTNYLLFFFSISVKNSTKPNITTKQGKYKKTNFELFEKNY